MTAIPKSSITQGPEDGGIRTATGRHRDEFGIAQIRGMLATPPFQGERE